MRLSLADQEDLVSRGAPPWIPGVYLFREIL